MKERIFKHLIAVLVLFGLLACLPGQSLAMQGLAPSGPIGGTDINQALIPPAGLYGGLVFGFLDFKGWMDEDGNKSFDAGDDATITAFGLSYAWDVKIFGGSVLSSFCAGYTDETWWIADSSNKDHFSGVSDIYADLFYWGRFFPSDSFLSQPKGQMVPFGLAVAGGLGITFPTGTYSEHHENNIGSNQYTYSPSISFTYTVPSLLGQTMGEGTQFSTRLFYNMYGRQKDRNYRNGDLLNIDYAVTQLKGRWQYGLTGTYYTQTTDDKFYEGTTGIKSETQLLSVGPLVGVNFNLMGKAFFAKFKCCYRIIMENGADSTVYFLSLGTSL